MELSRIRRKFRPGWSGITPKDRPWSGPALRLSGLVRFHLKDGDDSQNMSQALFEIVDQTYRIPADNKESPTVQKSCPEHGSRRILIQIARLGLEGSLDFWVVENTQDVRSRSLNWYLVFVAWLLGSLWRSYTSSVYIVSHRHWNASKGFSPHHLSIQKYCQSNTFLLVEAFLSMSRSASDKILFGNWCREIHLVTWLNVVGQLLVLDQLEKCILLDSNLDG